MQYSPCPVLSLLGGKSVAAPSWRTSARIFAIVAFGSSYWRIKNALWNTISFFVTKKGEKNYTRAIFKSNASFFLIRSGWKSTAHSSVQRKWKQINFLILIMFDIYCYSWPWLKICSYCLHSIHLAYNWRFNFYISLQIQTKITIKSIHLSF